MSSSYVPAGPEASPTSPGLQLSATQATAQTSSSSTTISPGSTASIVVFLTLFVLAVLGIVVSWVRRRRTTSKVPDVNPLKTESGHDVEALAATRQIAPAAPMPEVRWAPQIRSISCPSAADEVLSKKPAALQLKRARSPPPSKLSPPNPFLDPPPKSAPPRATSFSQNEAFLPEKAWKAELDPPVTPQALAVSGMETRTLGRSGIGFKG